MPDAALKLFESGSVSPGLLALVSADAPTRAILCAGAGGFERAYVTLTPGIYIGQPEDAVERVVDQFAALSERSGETVPESGNAQTTLEIGKALRALG